jgi:hypothetical protein
MKLFQCQCCGQILHFENTVCLRCGRSVGFLPAEGRMAAVEPAGGDWREAGAEEGQRWRFCHNWELSACNWLVPAEDAGGYCLACRHNRTVPDLSAPVNHARWQKIEAAKRRLIYTLLTFGLPLPGPGDGHPMPLVFDFLAEDPMGPKVLTGHDHGVVTISLTEADDAAREQLRGEMGEAYRTLLGHFRHEIGHYYWDLLLGGSARLDDFRAMFGDERTDYAESLQRHYASGPPADWQDFHVSAYATMHPWEDWAETWAHYLHIVDSLETAGAFGMRVDPPIDEEDMLAAEVDFDPYKTRRLRRLVLAWTRLTVALNAMNRSMGQNDLYPFALTGRVEDKLRFVHDVVRQATNLPPGE